MKEMAIIGGRIEGCIAFVCLFKEGDTIQCANRQ